jgi:protein PhnA
METLPACPKCNCEYTYQNDKLCVCPECFHEWDPTEEIKTEASENTALPKVFDVNGNQLQNGDTVITVKELAVKSAPRPLKAGTKVKNIRLTEGDHNIDCRIEGFGAMGLKSEFVKKA